MENNPYSDIKIEKYSLNDIPVIAELITDFAEESEGRPVETDNIADFLCKTDLISRFSNYYLAKTAYNNIAGFMTLTHIYSPSEHKLTLWIDSLYVAQGYRNRGVMRSLVTFAIEKAKEEKAEKINLLALENNPDAITAYKKLGFHRVPVLILEKDYYFDLPVFKPDKPFRYRFELRSVKSSTHGPLSSQLLLSEEEETLDFTYKDISSDCDWKSEALSIHVFDKNNRITILVGSIEVFDWTYGLVITFDNFAFNCDENQLKDVFSELESYLLSSGELGLPIKTFRFIIRGEEVSRRDLLERLRYYFLPCEIYELNIV